jgi:hypothetical protein
MMCGHDASAHPGIDLEQPGPGPLAGGCLRISGCGFRPVAVFIGMRWEQECDMAKPDAVFIYLGTYPSEAGARAGYDVVKDLHTVGAVGTCDAAVVTPKDAWP